MTLLQPKHTRYFTTIDHAIECYFVVRVPAKKTPAFLATVTVLQHDLDPRALALALHKAAEWFQDVAQGRVLPANAPVGLDRGKMYKPTEVM